MQNDLISRNALRQEVLDKMPQGGARGVFLAFIDEQPTAYDVEKVVEQVQDELFTYDIPTHLLDEIILNGGKDEQ